MAVMDFLLIAFLTLLNGLFAMSELALASSRKARLAAMDEAGDKGAHAALKLLEEPTQFLSTVQVGITSIGVLNGIVGEAAFSDSLAAQLVLWGLTDSVASVSATAIVVTPHHLHHHHFWRAGAQAHWPALPRGCGPMGGAAHGVVGQSGGPFCETAVAVNARHAKAHAH